MTGPIAKQSPHESEEVWYPEDMEAALPKLISLFYGAEVTRFAEAPSVELYRKILKASPRSERNLKHIVGLRLDKGKNLTSEDYLCGIEVYTHLTYKPPLIALIQKINKLYRHEEWARKAATQSLLALAISESSSSDLEIRRSVCSVVREAVTEAQSGIISQLYYDMPELEDHVLRLDDTLQSKGIPRAGGTPQQAQTRGKLIDQVRARALREPPVGHQPDVAGTLNDWLAVVEAWPNKKEQDELRASTRYIDSSELGDIDGLLDALITGLDRDEDREYLADGLRSLFGLEL